MAMTGPLSLKAKFGLGFLLSYTSFELYMHLRTQSIISNRKQVFKAESDKENDDSGKERFSSVTVAGMFVNPFEEYRPQTAFEFIFVRVMELFESLYGSWYELHGRVPEDHGKEVEDLLESRAPYIELLRANSTVLQQCISKNDFSTLTGASQIMSGTNSVVPSIRNQMLLTWLGQSCLLVQMSGINFLTDPILSNRLISEQLGPKRLVKSPMDLEDIKYATNNHLDFVLVSHDHPDHLELDLAGKIGNSASWIVPLGLRKKLARKGIYNVLEMDWWDSIPLREIHPRLANMPDEYEIVCVPAMHWSGRYIIDSNVSLWCSYIVKRNNEPILYHAGDTGYSEELFNQLSKKFGTVFMSLLPIGQYCPSWHQKPRHISPEEALKVAKSISSSYMLGIHWGTFKISSEPILEPKRLLEKLASSIGKSEQYLVPIFGLTYIYDMSAKQEVKV
ncbi:Piso0_000856 [Millerozyma farinosa CBS 7064]|uniref:Piso0_000856 protein n=1 Tax=Pichia sorbitophila (strain ATCC MYA-4447 / BCRC 22081 / CBS 7064 / NBRC 10061 / NRRL Y-12695) TaxID=559304 RepID=G8YQ90_PICSO|nr:Piso0_000856 [Millerozyma farinosa CBS 7064]